MRAILHEKNGISFSLVNYSNLDQLCIVMLGMNSMHSKARYQCNSCEYESYEELNNVVYDCLHSTWNASTQALGSANYRRIQEWIKPLLERRLNRLCSQCNSRDITWHQIFREYPNFLAFELSQCRGKMKIDHTLEVQDQRYRVCGLIYGGNFHFTARIISEDGTIWFHDGVETRSDCVYEGKIQLEADVALAKCRGKDICIAIYSLIV